MAATIPRIAFALQSGIDPRRIDLNAARRGLTSTEAGPLMVSGVVYAPTVRHRTVALEPEAGKEIWKCGWDARRGGASST